MRNLDEIENVYFLGIGGIGMSALARYFNSIGKNVYGYDSTSTMLTKKLESEGMDIHYDDNPNNIPDNIDIAVWTPAIHEDNAELHFLKKQNYPLLKRSEMLGLLSNHKNTIAIAGTHGKTSTSTIVSFLLHQLGAKPSAFVGGIMINFRSNCVINDSDLMVVEADEYDKSFMRLSPNVGVILSLDHDHSDIYPDRDVLIDTFRDFSLQIEEGGILWVAQDIVDMIDNDWRMALSNKDIALKTFGYEHGDIQASNRVLSNGEFSFIVNYNEQEAKFSWKIPGMHNLTNALVAIGICADLGYDLDNISFALTQFEGIRRRFEMFDMENGKILIDDYAHHPNEIKVAIDTVLYMYPEKKVTAVFQPHLFTRTRDFYEAFAEELSRVDEVVILPIYPAREEPIEGIDSALIFDRININKKRIVRKEELVAEWNQIENDVVVFLGAGDIDKEIEKIKIKYKI